MLFRKPKNHELQLQELMHTLCENTAKLNKSDYTVRRVHFCATKIAVLDYDKTHADVELWIDCTASPRVTYESIADYLQDCKDLLLDVTEHRGSRIKIAMEFRAALAMYDRTFTARGKDASARYNAFLHIDNIIKLIDQENISSPQLLLFEHTPDMESAQKQIAHTTRNQELLEAILFEQHDKRLELRAHAKKGYFVEKVLYKTILENIEVKLI